MKKLSFFFSVFFLFTLNTNSSASPQKFTLPPYHSTFIDIITDYFTPTDNIFFIDPDTDMLFIDFHSVKDKIVSVQIKQNNKQLFAEDVQHLSSRSIYQFPVDLFDSGLYQVEILTKAGFKYSQDLRINTSCK